MKKNETGGLSWPVALLVTVLICSMAFLTARLLAPDSSRILSDVTLLPCTASQTIEPLGKGVVYSDGTTLRALNAKGRQIWSYVVGSDCEFSVGEGGVAGWSGDSIVALNSASGEALFSGSLNQTILSAVVGPTYAAALVGEEGDGTLIVLELSGREIDRISLTDTIVLDYGFFNNGGMLWVMSLDTNGTVPMSQITTYKPGRMQSGSITDSEQIVYKVMFDSPSVYAVGTTYIRSYDYTGVENTADRTLVYGWYLLDAYDSDDGSLMTFVPMSEVGATMAVSDVRVICGSVDRTVRMPFSCFALAAQSDAVYGVSDQYLMIYGLNATHAETYQLPFECDGLIGLTDGQSAVLVSGESVYLVALP